MKCSELLTWCHSRHAQITARVLNDHPVYVVPRPCWTGGLLFILLFLVSSLALSYYATRIISSSVIGTYQDDNSVPLELTTVTVTGRFNYSTSFARPYDLTYDAQYYISGSTKIRRFSDCASLSLGTNSSLFVPWPVVNTSLAFNGMSAYRYLWGMTSHTFYYVLGDGPDIAPAGSCQHQFSGQYGGFYAWFCLQ